MGLYLCSIFLQFCAVSVVAAVVVFLGVYLIPLFYIRPELDSVMATPLLIMCIKLCNLRINCGVLMSVFLLHTVKHHICLFECDLVLRNDLELARFL